VKVVKVLDAMKEDNDRELDISGAPDDGAKLPKEEENVGEDEGVLEITDELVASNSLLTKVSTEVLREDGE
jgi:hypothetical protein